MKRIFVIHGWGGTTDREWFPWIKKELSDKGFDVHVPQMPDTEYPKVDAWVGLLAELVGKADADTFFVGHSIGCLTILKYLETLNDEKIGGAVFVAPWTHLLPAALEDDEDKETARPWLETHIEWGEVKKHTDKFTCIFSDDDPFVPLNDSEIFKEKLGARIIVEHKAYHFSEDNNTTEVPVALKEILSMTE